MPVYEYECAGCGATFEKLVRLSQPPVIRCPTCQGEQVRRLLSVCGFTGQGLQTRTASGGSSCGSCTSHSCGSCHCGG
ncbi:MAG: zinc ribbon domain-containing protein [Myxococcota bacterium]|jgi:putative FmdB family regulatory protein|nr:zinc ribbon domain-containing protein [Myxococcota bacterium]